MKRRVGELLEAGWSRQRIARELGIDPSTVTRHARLLGYPDVVPRQSLFNWEAIQEYYDQGHTIDECKERFGVSYGAWDKAAVRGDIVTRLRSKRQLSHETRDRVEALLGDGLKPAEVARKLRAFKVNSRVSLSETRLPGGSTIRTQVWLDRFPQVPGERRVGVHHCFVDPQGAEIESNPQVALLFHWPTFGRQAHITGRAVPAERALAEEAVRGDGDALAHR